MTANPKTLTTLATTIGLVVGSLGMWFTIQDRVAKERALFEQNVQDRVTKEIKMEVRIAKLEEKLESIRAEIWTQRTTPQK